VLLYECIGTAILLAAVNYSSFTLGDDKAGFAVPIALFAIIMMIGSVSGGHVNPAVSTSVFIAEGKMGNFGYLLGIVAAQVLGAFIGCQLTSLVG
jgi:glycerol uptake facilitator-like aquaporin